MDYIEIKVIFEKPDPWKEIFTMELAEAGCDSFAEGEKEDTLLAYIPENLFDEKKMKLLLSCHDYDVKLKYSFTKIETQDWNAIWESEYSPVMIANRCLIRAPFHEKGNNIEYEIIIEPKMSFGTAHHETTALMVEYLLEEEVNRKKVLDMGAGTGILAIFAHKMGASSTTAIDNDEWAYRNNLENNINNDISNMTVILGDATNIPNEQFDIILANINRNILLRDLPLYAQFLKKGGTLFLSGFYENPDLSIIEQKCKEVNLYLVNFKEKNNWVAAKFISE